MKKLMTFALSAALMLGATFAVQAQHGPHGKDMAAHMAYMTKALGLTADQQAAVKQLHTDLMAKSQPLMLQHRQQRTELKALMNGVNPSSDEIGQKTLASHNTELQLKALHDEFKTKFKALLTPDQQTKLTQLEASHPHGHGGPLHGSPTPEQN
ncbi:MAG TPA: periplasmic heavy metal sensor [Thermoanaerobaculia bacterium]|jgi:Spy/CpxP family protein refolding chaperone|nr:periplasmic heavy metal sensor [Thermoanaerobaculia bacterium]